MLAVDLFTGYLQVIPIKDRKTNSLIMAVEEAIIRPFSVPKFIRSDNEPGLWTTKEFYSYIQPFGIELITTSTGAPWANGHAERAIKTIKETIRKFIMQEKDELIGTNFLLISSQRITDPLQSMAMRQKN